MVSEPTKPKFNIPPLFEPQTPHCNRLICKPFAMLTEMMKTTTNASQTYKLTPLHVSDATRHDQGVHTPKFGVCDP